jgi:hypothetical protein
VYGDAKPTQGAEMLELAPYVYKVSKNGMWEGNFIDFEYQDGADYVLEYDILPNTPAKVDWVGNSKIVNIGCHNNGTFVAPDNYITDNENFIKVTRVSTGKSVGCSYGDTVVDISSLKTDKE